MDTDKLEWEEARRKVMTKHLARDEARDFQIDIVKLESDSTFDEHGHPDVEWVYVLEGSMQDGNGAYEKGHFIINEKGSRHVIKTGPEGCKILVCWCGRLEK